jgi:hypothetical protein
MVSKNVYYVCDILMTINELWLVAKVTCLVLLCPPHPILLYDFWLLFRIRISIDFVWLVQIRLQEGKNNPQKFQVFSASCSLLKARDSSCSLDVLYEGLRISKLQFLIKVSIFSVIHFFSRFFVVWIRIEINTNPKHRKI